MIFYKKYDYSKLNAKITKVKDKIYDDNIYTIDFESTNLYNFIDEKTNKDNWVSFRYNHHDYTEIDKQSIVYIWQFSINNDVVYGRTLNQLRYFLIKLNSIIPTKKIVYAHNLSYEFHILRNIIKDFEVFARKKYKPIYATTNKFNIEFRCSFFLTMSSLENLSKQYQIETCKTMLDYDIVRHSKTILTDDELLYCENDCRVLYEVINIYKKEYKHLHSIPLTQTGIIRKKIKGKLYQEVGYQKFIKSRYPKDYKNLLFQTTAFAGGYTHANSMFANQIHDNIESYDIGSSYPAVMLFEKYPCSLFHNIKINDLSELKNNRHYIIDITFNDIKPKLLNTYLSYHKALNGYNMLSDNGRLISADRARYILTEIDLKIINECYSYNSYVINKVQTSRSEYIRTPNLLSYIAELYAGKTTLKGIKEREHEYMRIKEMINSIYGMCVTNIYKDEILYNILGWDVDILTPEKTNEKIKENLESKLKLFLLYIWGVYITAYARYNLWSMIIKCDKDLIYSDTDSVKIKNGEHNREYFLDYNKEIDKKIIATSKANNIPLANLKPYTIKGECKPIGYFEYECTYKRFITLGAKKYCYEWGDGSLGITLAGVHKKKGINAINKIEDFKKGLFFDYKNSGRMLSYYNENQRTISVTDREGVTLKCKQKYGQVLCPTTYLLGITDDYEILVNSKQTTASEILVKGELKYYEK